MATAAKIDVKAAVAQAMKYFQAFEGLMPVRDIRLEETELDDSENWLITLSADDTALSGPLGEIASAFGKNRIYKIFRIDGRSGDVLSMKVRNLEPAS